MSVGKTVDELGTELGERIAATDEYERFEAAKRAVENDEEAQKQIEEFEQLRQEFTLARQTGSADQNAVDEVTRAQRELHSLPVMQEYLAAKEELQERLELINQAISDPLAVDFGGEAGGCCQH
jgi:cell fate (sporulation/competence/biofilm development) regulator YlbF (YheA/YmcA/DUF963 family)